MPEPPPRPSRPAFADELRRPAPPPMPERRSDPLTGFSPESLGARTEPVPPRMPARRTDDAAAAARERAAQGAPVRHLPRGTIA